jgi:ribosomal protein S18 acetylase RimI-like enzyme
MGVDEATGVSLRDANAEDAVQVEAVHWASRNAAYRHVAGWPPVRPDRGERVERWFQWLSDPDIVSLVAEFEGVVVGFCTLRACREGDLDSILAAEMPTLYVHPDFWERGIGKRLCNAALQRAADAGFDTLIVWSMEFNTRADRFYVGLGFVREDVTMAADWPFESLRGRRYRRDIERLDRVVSDSAHASL